MVDFLERITILTANEIEEIYGLPTFSDEERELYFGYFGTTPKKEHFGDYAPKYPYKLFVPLDFKPLGGQL